MIGSERDGENEWNCGLAFSTHVDFLKNGSSAKKGGEEGSSVHHHDHRYVPALRDGEIKN